MGKKKYYAVDTFSHIKLNVYDIHGRKIIMLVDEYKSAGYYDAVFDGGYLVSGIYFYQLSCGLKRLTGKMMLIK